MAEEEGIKVENKSGVFVSSDGTVFPEEKYEIHLSHGGGWVAEERTPGQNHPEDQTGDIFVTDIEICM